MQEEKIFIHVSLILHFTFYIYHFIGALFGCADLLLVQSAYARGGRLVFPLKNFTPRRRGRRSVRRGLFAAVEGGDLLGCASAAVLAEGLLAAVEGGDLFGAGAQRLGEGGGLQHPHATAQREQAR